MTRLAALVALALASSASAKPLSPDTALISAVSDLCLPQVLGTRSVVTTDKAALAGMGLSIPAAVPAQFRGDPKAPNVVRSVEAMGEDVWLVVSDGGHHCDIYVYGGPIESARQALIGYLDGRKGEWNPLARLTQTFDGKRRQVYERFSPDKSEVGLFMTTPDHPDTVGARQMTLVTVVYIPPQQP